MLPKPAIVVKAYVVAKVSGRWQAQDAAHAWVSAPLPGPLDKRCSVCLGMLLRAATVHWGRESSKHCPLQLIAQL